MHRFQPGDLFACHDGSLRSRLSLLGAVSGLGARTWPLPGPSHVAVCCHDRTGELAWWEAAEQPSHPARRCTIQGRRVRGLQAHPPAARLDDVLRGGGRVTVYRLVEIDALTSVEGHNLFRTLRGYVTRNTSALSAAQSLSGLPLPWLWSWLDRSERESLFGCWLIAACLMRLGRLNRANPTSFHPAKLVRTLVAEGTYRREQTFDHIDQLDAADVIPLGRCA